MTDKEVMPQKIAGLTRREFIALPMEERNRILKEQAEQSYQLQRERGEIPVLPSKEGMPLKCCGRFEDCWVATYLDLSDCDVCPIRAQQDADQKVFNARLIKLADSLTFFNLEERYMTDAEDIMLGIIAHLRKEAGEESC